MRIAAAGNVEVPAYLALKQKGYAVSQEGNDWVATRDGFTLYGGSPLELLGLSSIYEVRGAEWKATDTEVEDFFSRYPQS